MPSPFPGMDPFLEHPLLWPTLQQYVVNNLADRLGETLPRRYQAGIRERIYQEAPDGDLFPAGPPPPQYCPVPMVQKAHGNGVRPITPCWNIPLTPQEVREPYVAITLAGAPERMVTVIEVLTLANKTAGHIGRHKYREQQRQLLAGSTNLLELDLLLGGQHTVVAPRERLLRRGSYDYLVCLSRARQRDFCEVWGFTLAQPLPQVPVPLAEDEADAIVDLQAVLRACYEAGSFQRWIDYSGEPYVELSSRQRRWVESVLKACAAPAS